LSAHFSTADESALGLVDREITRSTSREICEQVEEEEEEVEEELRLLEQFSHRNDEETFFYDGNKLE
jgi:hypothetical protein